MQLKNNLEKSIQLLSPSFFIQSPNSSAVEMEEFRLKYVVNGVRASSGERDFRIAATPTIHAGKYLT